MFPRDPSWDHYLLTYFLNNIFYFVKKSSLYNYIDDNTLSYSHHGLLKTKNVPTSESEHVIEWFGTNQMQANPGKFQAIVLGKRGHDDCESFTIHDNTIKCEDSVKLLRVTIANFIPSFPDTFRLAPSPPE